MDSAKDNFEALFERVENYTKTTIEITKLKAIDSAINVTASLIAKMGVVMVLSLFFLVFNIGIAIYLGEVLEKLYYGFFIVAGFYLILGVIFHFFLHKWIKRPIADIIVKQIFNN
jgi:hypothetical protein